MTKIKLKYPIKQGEQEIKEVTLRRPKVKDQLAVEHAGSDAAREIALISMLSGVTEEAITELDIYDYGQIQKEFEGFLFQRMK